MKWTLLMVLINVLFWATSILFRPGFGLAGLAQMAVKPHAQTSAPTLQARTAVHLQGVFPGSDSDNTMLPSSSGETLAEKGISVQLCRDPRYKSADILYQLPCALHVYVTIHDLSGRKVATLTDDIQKRGRIRLRWQGLNDKGQRLPVGLYMCRMVTEGVFVKQKVLLL